ncbi:hypothetical protein PPERSA_03889 [Pseudocohnilembus persalinus]|uniref:Uncharacterized protein n=1 Tax=Pseudocohnilembus persalinus TaxID=266149 RepID=A0A0V0Q927_PSEPJ|nr:hypothetical protein PPERSA_03889 [Pseudocohnilembus persalinus]|eukprot:KRW98754.1 hypothetical protein PPERSA_03889 [Pseudocohnilembus persalinus]
MSVAAQAIRKYQNKNLLKSHLAALLGFLGGAKVCDLIFYNDAQYEQLREDMEDEYWAKNGEPKVLKPYLVKSSVPGREDITRKSWIYIMYEKDKMITKKEDLD